MKILRECVAILQFSAAPLIGSIVQAMFYEISLVWICTVFSLLFVFINIQNKQISQDPLTGINNRGQLNRFLAARTSAPDALGRLYLVLIDVDQFKTINDTLGHVAGDSVLIHTAMLLKEIVAQQNDFLARYGGDEFAIICFRDTEEEVSILLTSIRKKTEAYVMSAERTEKRHGC